MSSPPKSRSTDERILTIRMTELEAAKQGLLFCECGHPPNNHFDHGTEPCAHCRCEAYVQRTRYGKILKTEKAQK